MTQRTQSQGDVCAILSASDRSGYHQSALAARAPREYWCNENDDERRIFQRGDVIAKNIVSFEFSFRRASMTTSTNIIAEPKVGRLAMGPALRTAAARRRTSTGIACLQRLQRSTLKPDARKL